MLGTNFSPWPSFTDEEANAVSRVLLSNRVNYWTGEECRRFEQEFAEWTGARHAIALANGTVALDLALAGMRIEPGDEVIVTPRTFIASVSSVVNAGAMPVFADVERESGNITAATIAAVLSPRTKAVIPVHLGGWPCDMDPIMALAGEHGLTVIEDCAQAHGALYRGRSVGTIGHIGAWSFCQDKIMTTGGEGGMVTTNDQSFWSRMWSYKDHGKDFDAVYHASHPPGHRWVHHSFGTNWRMIEMQAVIGRIQLQRMPEWIERRQHNAKCLDEALQPFAGEQGVIRLPRLNDAGSVHAYYKYYCYVRPENLRPQWSRDKIVAEIVARGVPCYQGSSSEVYRERAFEGHPARPAQPLSAARELGETSLMFLVHPTLSPEEMEKTATAIGEVLSEASSDGGVYADRVA